MFDMTRQTYTNYNLNLHKLTKNLHITHFLLTSSIKFDSGK